MATRPLAAVELWRQFANATHVDWNGNRRTWARHIGLRPGFNDEERLIQPYVFRLFARDLLNFAVGENLAAEVREETGRPDFTPADAVTHPFVFETKSTRYGTDLQHLDQVELYLTQGGRRIHRVVLTNLVGLRVYSRGQDGRPLLDYQVDLRGLLEGSAVIASGLADAANLARFIDDHTFVALSTDQKRERLREAPPWNPLLEVTSPKWVSARLDATVEILRADVARRVRGGALLDDVLLPPAERRLVLQELQELEWRIAADPPEQVTRGLEDYLAARPNTDAARALAQYEAHVAYFTATRLLLVRVWEDLGLIQPTLHDGAFRDELDRFDGVIDDVIQRAFGRARTMYPTLFDRPNTYTWYRPDAESHVEALYELSNTYLGAIESDVLGSVYETLLERVDRKLLGQYYTPRDIIALIWDLVDLDVVAASAEDAGRSPRVLDIATGSGGFLVEAARRLRERAESQLAAGAQLNLRTWVAQVSQWLIGVEYQRFPAYLAELNLLIQLGLIFRNRGDLAIPAVGVIWDDTLRFHNRNDLGLADVEADHHRGPGRDERLDPEATGAWFDVAIGNPPYIGEKKAGRLLARTRRNYPYWDQFGGAHLDYLYWFLILGISKLAPGGRFGFITTEYWLRARGARSLRRFLAENAQIDRLLIFRDLRLFADAPGQHSMIVIGTRFTGEGRRSARPPRVSLYTGPNVRDRQAIVEAMREAASRGPLRTFRSSVVPSALAEQSWGEAILTPEQVERRAQLRGGGASVSITLAEGLVSSADRLTDRDVARMTQDGIAAIGGAGQRPGIFVLNADEVRSLGELSPAEVDALRPIVNTRDVYAYAAVPPVDGESLVYLPPVNNPRGLTAEEVRRLPFPDGLPALGRHLAPFEPVLLAKVRQYNARRPWWTIHNHRPGIAGHEGAHETWADYALISRWGVGGKLAAGLAPRGVKPASGLHAVMSDDVPAAYLVGLLNSEPVQAIADSYPPGMLRQEDLTDIGLPTMDPERVRAIADLAMDAGGAVVDLVRMTPNWPLLAQLLRAPVNLGEDVCTAWRPTPGPTARWGRLADLRWLAVETSGPLSGSIQGVAVEHGVFGTAIVATGGRKFVRLRLALPETGHEDEGALAETVCSYVLGLAATGSKLSDIAGAPGPVDAHELTRRIATDAEAVAQLADRYNRCRNQINAVVAQVL